MSDGKEALKQLKNFKPDVVLLAYDLPTFNGIEITKTIRNEGNNVPIIAYTHNRDKEIIKHWIPLGLSGYLIKPSKKSLILKSVNEALKMPVDIIPRQKHDGKEAIKWVEEYSVGHKGLDDQHKMLFSMINEFFHKDDEQAAVSLFQNLSSYIDLHFESEENLLRQINYPDTEGHIKKHNELRKKFKLIESKFQNYDWDTHHKIGMFLYNWLAKHILKSDMEYKKYALLINIENFKD